MIFHRKSRLKSAVFVSVLGLAGLAIACASAPRDGRASDKVRPGISVLLEDRIGLITGRRLGLITNQTGVNEKGDSDIDLLATGSRAQKARVKVVALFSPEHGLRGTEDHAFVDGEKDPRSGLVAHSLYGAGTIAPPDSLLVGVETFVVDLQDSGTRTWTYVGVMLYAMRAAARNHIPILVLDRPNPLTGARADGALLDSAIANADDPRPGKPGKAAALYPVPLRHGLTMGEMALMFNAKLGIGAELTVVPVAGCRRAMWFDETKLPFVRPSPNLPSLTSMLVYPGLVAFEASNLSVGRGTDIAFQRIGAPWLKSREVADLLNDRLMPGVKFEAESFTPDQPTDNKFPGQRLNGVRVVVTDRDRLNPARVGAAVLWAIAKTSPSDLTLRAQKFDDLFGAARLREALVRGEDPDTVMDRELASATVFREMVKPYLLYR